MTHRSRARAATRLCRSAAVRSRRALAEALEPRQMLSASAFTVATTPDDLGGHLVGCNCGACTPYVEYDRAAGASLQQQDVAFAEQPLTKTRRQAKVRSAAPAALKPTPALSAQPTGALSGKIVYVNAGHGFAYDATAGVWRTGRGETNEMVEDFGNQDQLQSYVDYLFNAGATVVPLRPVGHQPNEVVLDNDSPGVTFSAGWSNSTSPIFYGTAGDAVPYRFATTGTTETAVATYRPNLPQTGFYPVYTWVRDGTDRAADSLYRVNHSGGSTEVKIDHRLVGEGWVYLGSYHFDGGTGGSVQVSNRSASAGSVVVADAIRFGNGRGTISRGGGTSGQTREDEASLYWLEAMNGVGTTFGQFRTLSDDEGANVSAPARYAAFMNNAPLGQALYLGFHTNAGGGTSRGTIGLFNSPENATPNQQRWAFLTAKEVNDDLVSIGGPPLESAWWNRTGSALTLDRADIDFGEISDNANNDEFDATILEVGFHDNATDAALLRDPKVRDYVGRATYQATVRYFNEFGASGGGAAAPLAFAPAAPTNVRATSAANGDVTVAWAAPASTAASGGSATGYRLYASRNGYGFDGGIAIAGGATASHTIPAAAARRRAHYFRVVAINAGARPPARPWSRAARNAAGARAAADRQRVRPPRPRAERATVGAARRRAASVIDRVRPRLANSFDYVVQAGEAVEAFAARQVGFDTADNAAIVSGQVALGLPDRHLDVRRGIDGRRDVRRRRAVPRLRLPRRRRPAVRVGRGDRVDLSSQGGARTTARSSTTRSAPPTCRTTPPRTTSPPPPAGRSSRACRR